MIKLLDDNLKSREDVKVLLEQEDDQMIDAIVSSKDKEKKKGREVLITSNYEPDKRTGRYSHSFFVAFQLSDPISLH